MFLLDTNVLSELRVARRANPEVLRWARNADSEQLFLSAVSIMEIEIGVLRAERRDRAKGAILRTWLEHHVLPAFEDRIVPVDTAVARVCAALHLPNPKPTVDALIAATAMVHRMTLVTRNTSDFAGTRLSVLNPWQP